MYALSDRHGTKSGSSENSQQQIDIAKISPHIVPTPIGSVPLRSITEIFDQTPDTLFRIVLMLLDKHGDSIEEEEVDSRP